MLGTSKNEIMDYEQKYKEALSRAKLSRLQLLDIGEEATEIEYIFPELRESDDDSDKRIHTIKVFYPSIGIRVEEAIEKCIAYSKKEGNMLISINGIFLLVTQLSTVEKVIEEYNKCVGNSNDIKEKVNPMVQWTADDESYLKGVICDIECEVLCANCSRNIADMKINWLKSLKDRVQPQSKQEWSEEDKKMENLIISILISIGTLNLERYHKMNLDEVKKWLKSLKERIQPKTYQDCGEEDEKIRKEIIEYLDVQEVLTQGKDSDFKEWIAWLESLKPNLWKTSEDKKETKNKCPNYSEGYGCSTTPLKKCDTCPDYKLYNHWKPSEEQMIALRWVLNNIPYNRHKEVITQMVEQFKKI